jgi:hypothetical protein
VSRKWSSYHPELEDAGLILKGLSLFSHSVDCGQNSTPMSVCSCVRIFSFFLDKFLTLSLDNEKTTKRFSGQRGDLQHTKQKCPVFRAMFTNGAFQDKIGPKMFVTLYRAICAALFFFFFFFSPQLGFSSPTKSVDQTLLKRLRPNTD